MRVEAEFFSTFLYLSYIDISNIRIGSSKMIKFIIIEDEEKYTKKYEDVINSILFKTPKDYGILKFTKYNNELKKVIRDNSEMKVYLVDLQLNNNYDGMNILREIRDNDWDSEIIVLTNHDRMFESVHKEIYRTFDFIEKFVDLEKRLKKDIKKIISKNHDNGKFVYKTRKIELQIYYKDIIYIYRDTVERKLFMKTSYNHFIIDMSMKNMIKMLDDRFVMCHRSCIVNNDRISEKNYVKGYFITDMGEKIDLLSKKYRVFDNDDC